MSGHTFAQMFKDGEICFWSMPLFSRAEVGMALRASARQVGIPKKLHFDKASDKMGLHSKFQCVIIEFSIKWLNSEPFSH